MVIWNNNYVKINIIDGTIAINPNVKGNKLVQQITINCVYFHLGKVALTQIKIKKIKETFNPKIKDENTFGIYISKLVNQPPKNNITVIVDIKSIEEYSPKKICKWHCTMFCKIPCY